MNVRQRRSPGGLASLLVLGCLSSLLAVAVVTGARAAGSTTAGSTTTGSTTRPTPGAGSANQENAGPGAVTHAKASATGLHLILSEPGALPIEPILDVSLGATRGALDQSTNEATAFAASGYPGDVLVNPLSLVSLGFAPDHIITRITKALPIAVTGWPITPWTLKAEAEDPAHPEMKKDIVNTARALPIGLQTRQSLQDASANQTETGATAALDATVNSPLTAFPSYHWLADLAEVFLKPYLGAFTINLDGPFLDVRGLTSATRIQDLGPTTQVTTETSFASIDLLGGLIHIGPSRAAISQEGGLSGVSVTRQEAEAGPIAVMGVRVSVSGGALRVADQRIPSQHLETVRRLLSRIMTIAGVKVVGSLRSVEGGVAQASALQVTIPIAHPKVVVVPPGTATITVGIGQVSSDLSLTPEPKETPPHAPASAGTGGDRAVPVALGLVAHRLRVAYTAMASFAVLAVLFAVWSWRRRADKAHALQRMGVSA